MSKLTAKLKTFRFHDIDGAVYASGEIYDDDACRFRSGALITTSRIVGYSVSATEYQVETLNTIYICQKKDAFRVFATDFNRKLFELPLQKV